ncbi:DNA sulfur modification protein DndD [Ramlibacter rhizophilus]|uniref:DNA sulfur modification protein DndD n=1 Tax=Ramlibacter rhizophilus TaxID=1781167 RepID=A0A4Z0BYK0_9BURK|nr:DNA sulfur modification protein DndD [Ramlibacter rhizophilus]TFZ03380.1 DNA sulfur modification protein DndD [Ramlibacter rhizophilus]
MLLEKLVLCDIGTFRGEQAFDLAPRGRPVVLFGGLNGAGKTTVLTSVRHCLYGRQALDGAVTQAQYQEFLRGLIHNPSQQLIKPDRAHVQIHFVYSRFGKRTRYQVTRSWVDKGSSVEESLVVRQEDDATVLLQGDSAQTFLSQLIPAGVSQFFFFDGEKIAALAKDDADTVLSDAIRRLLGLDTADRLRSDLAVFLRARRLQGAAGRSRSELLDVSALIQKVEAEIKAGEAELEGNCTRVVLAAQEKVSRAKASLTERGGGWSVDRKALEARLDRLQEEQSEAEQQLREEFAGLSVFALAPVMCKTLLSEAKKEQKAQEETAALVAVSAKAAQLKEMLDSALRGTALAPEAKQCVDAWVSGLGTPSSNSAPLHGFATSDVRRLEESLLELLPLAKEKVSQLGRKLDTLRGELTAVQDQLARAPTEESLQETFERYQAAAAELARAQAQKRRRLELLRALVMNHIGLLRRRRQLEEQLERVDGDSRAEETAQKVQELIELYKARAAREKCKTLERHFVTAFRRLARKEDIIDHAVIDPDSFAVTLVDRHGRETPKKRLSAGEKQIFAIAMLEALAKTSGRNLPIIIDTPLGRLDSKHRAKLVESYFPMASHQVIVLSTDTEVDQAFYTGMRPHISHSFHLVFSETEGCTTASKGYFWSTQQELKHAA